MRAGFATTVITPELPVYLAGYGDRREPATAVHDDLQARVLVLEMNGARCCLVTCDLLAMSRDFSDPVRHAVAAIARTDVANVLTSCTHVHAGPSTLTGTDAIGWPVSPGYRESLIAHIAAATRRAIAAMTPVETRYARVTIADGIAVNRRGHALRLTSTVIMFDPVALVANFGIHPTVTGPTNLAVATDWVGPFRRGVEARTGMPAMFLQGCQGDVNPARTSWEDGSPTTWGPVVDAYAEPLARCIAEAAATAAPVDVKTLAVRRRTIDVPVGDTLLAALAGGAPTRAIELVSWRLGDLAVIAVPGEGFHGLEREVRSRHADPLLLAGLAPDWHGYFPVPYTDGYEEGLSLGAEAVGQLVEALTG
jgi:neutral ceramidase